MRNVNRCSPNQLVFGSNPNLSNNIEGKTSYEGKTSSEIVAKKLNAIHIARKAFIKRKSGEGIRRALLHQTRISMDTKYLTGDIFFHKTNNTTELR